MLGVRIQKHHINMKKGGVLEEKEWSAIGDRRKGAATPTVHEKSCPRKDPSLEMLLRQPSSTPSRSQPCPGLDQVDPGRPTPSPALRTWRRGDICRYTKQHLRGSLQANRSHHRPRLDIEVVVHTSIY